MKQKSVFFPTNADSILLFVFTFAVLTFVFFHFEAMLSGKYLTSEISTSQSAVYVCVPSMFPAGFYM